MPKAPTTKPAKKAVKKVVKKVAKKKAAPKKTHSEVLREKHQKREDKAREIAESLVIDEKKAVGEKGNRRTSTVTAPTKTSKRRLSALAKELSDTEEKDLLPHEILLKIARGECFKLRHLVIDVYKTGEFQGQERARYWEEYIYNPTFAERIDACKAAAPYFAPRLSAQTIGAEATSVEALTNVLAELGAKMPN